MYDCQVLTIKNGTLSTGWVSIQTDLPDGRVQFKDLPEREKAAICDAEEARKARKEAEARKAREESAARERQLKANTAYTIILGHRAYAQAAANKSGCEELHYISLTKGGGNIMIVLSGYPAQKSDDRRIDYVFCETWEQVAAEFGEVRGNAIYTPNPAQTIGRGGETIKFLSAIAGKRLKVVAV